VIRPIRFEPPLLSTAKPTESIHEEHARALQAVRAEVDNAIARHEQARADLEHTARAFSAAIERLDARDAEVLDALQRRAVQFAVQLAEEIVGRELASCDDIVAASLARALQFVPDRGEIAVRIHPADVDVARTTVDAHVELSRRLELIPDPSIESGGCIVVVGALRIDGQMGAALTRVREELALPGPSF